MDRELGAKKSWFCFFSPTGILCIHEQVTYLFYDSVSPFVKVGGVKFCKALCDLQLTDAMELFPHG